jgi:hypothetical protein
VIAVVVEREVLVLRARAGQKQRRAELARGRWTDEGPADRQVGVGSARSAGVISDASE